LALLLSLRAAPDFTTMYSTSAQIHARVQEAAERNSAGAAGRRYATLDAAAALDDPHTLSRARCQRACWSANASARTIEAEACCWSGTTGSCC